MEKINAWCSALDMSNLSNNVKLLGRKISKYYTPGKLTAPTQEMLANDCKVSSTTTIRAGVRKLEKAGFITTKKERFPGTQYETIVYFFKGVNDHSHFHQTIADRCNKLEEENKILLAKCEFLENKLSKYDKVYMEHNLRKLELA